MVRFLLFVGVTLYAWVAVVLLEQWRQRKAARMQTRAAST